MQDAEVPVAIMTNCNQFVALAENTNDKGQPVIDFSEPVTGGEASKSMLASSQLGFLLSATTFAFHCHTKDMSRNELTGYTKLPMTLLLEIFTHERFAGEHHDEVVTDSSRSRGAEPWIPPPSPWYADPGAQPLTRESCILPALISARNHVALIPLLTGCPPRPRRVLTDLDAAVFWALRAVHAADAGRGEAGPQQLVESADRACGPQR